MEIKKALRKEAREKEKIRKLKKLGMNQNS
jgi:hypothetical protein